MATLFQSCHSILFFLLPSNFSISIVYLHYPEYICRNYRVPFSIKNSILLNLVAINKMEYMEEALYRYLKPVAGGPPFSFYSNALPCFGNTPLQLPGPESPDSYYTPPFTSSCPSWQTAVSTPTWLTDHLPTSPKKMADKKNRQLKAAKQAGIKGKFSKLTDSPFDKSDAKAARGRDYHNRRVCLFCKKAYSTSGLYRHTSSRCKAARRYPLKEREKRHAQAPLAQDYFHRKLRKLVTPPIVEESHSDQSIQENDIDRDDRLETMLEKFHSLYHPKFRWANLKNTTVEEKRKGKRK